MTRVPDGIIEREPDLDLGSGVFGWWTSYDARMPGKEPLRAGLIYCHPDAADAPEREGDACYGTVLFRLPELEYAFPGRPTWEVVQWEPLTLSPSLRCSCGHHGFIREGRWQGA
jgi:hypothetical protein